MLLSIIVATKGRKDEVAYLLDSINGIDLNLIEVLIIDQNVSNELSTILERYKDLLIIKHIKAEANGASNARNIGVRNSSGKYLCFPDDDCKFFPNTIQIALERIVDFDVVFGRCVDELGKNSVINFAEGNCEMNIKNYEGRFVEATMFVRREIMLEFPYDEGLGVGTFHGAEEAYDLVLRLLKSKRKLYYSSEIVFYHPSKILNYISNNEIRRVFSYRCGFSRLCLKHKLYTKLLSRILSVFFYLIVLFIIQSKKQRYYSSELLGLLSGIVIK